MIKLIASDLDGTLLNNEGKISSYNEAALKNALKNNVKVVIASGRPFFSVERFLKQIDNFAPNSYSICFNGALLINNHTKQIVASNNILGKDVKRGYALSKKMGTGFLVYSLQQHVCFNENSEFVQFEIDLVGAPYDQIDINSIDDNEEFIKMSFPASKEVLDKNYHTLEENFAFTHKVVRSHNVFMEVLNPKASKGSCLEIIMEKEHIAKDEALTFGDNDNDLELIQCVKYGYVTSNSPSKMVRQSAYAICPSNEENGVGQTINSYLSVK